MLWKKFVIGAAIVLPLVVVCWVVEFVFNFTSSLLRPLFEPLFERFGLVGRFDDLVLAAFALLITFFVLCVIGAIASHRLFAGKVRKWHDKIDQIPLIGVVYSAVRQLVKSLGQENIFKEPVYIPYPAPPCEVIGFVTGRDYRDNCVVLRVFVPSALSPTEGTFVFVPENMARRCDLAPEEAYKLVICGGLSDR